MLPRGWPTRPPVELELWPAAPAGNDRDAPSCFTTVASWDNSGKNIEFKGTTYIWSKHTNFLSFIDLPQYRPKTCFRLAMRPLDPSVRQKVEGHGWQLAESGLYASDPNWLRCRDFLAQISGPHSIVGK